MIEKESLTHRIEDDLERRNRNWDIIDAHLQNYTEQRQQDQLKLAKVEKELNDFKGVINQVNINQEATQKASGYGIISLPKNAANGQVSVSVKGNTETDEEGNTKSTISAMRLKSVGKNLFGQYTDTYTRSGVTVKNNKNGTFTLNGVSTLAVELELSKSTYFNVKLQEAIRCEAGQEYSLSQKNISGTASPSVFPIASYHSDSGTKSFDWLMENKSKVADESGYVTMIRIYAPKGTVFSNYTIGVQFNRGKPTEYEPYKESTAYVVAKDKDNKIVNLNTVKDTTGNIISQDRIITKENGEMECILENKSMSNVAISTVINYTDMKDGGYFNAYGADGEYQVGVKGDTLTFTATKLIYQLAEPVEIPIEVSGNIVSYPSGTIYIERAVPDAGIYTDKMTVLHQDLPIKALGKLSKIDFMTGLETELNVSDAVIAENKLSFTHPDLVDGDIVFFTYEYDRESTECETEIEYYDSRYVIQDSVTGKFYKWTIAVADGVPSIQLQEV